MVDPEQAAEQCVHNKEEEPTLEIKFYVREDVEEQEGSIFNFYKACNTDWARPFQAKLQGIVIPIRSSQNLRLWA